MIKKLTKHGDEWALVIEKPVLEQLKIDPETPLEVTTEGQILIVSPAQEVDREAKFRAALEKTNRSYGRTLKKLAE
jgi:hypothetical protein